MAKFQFLEAAGICGVNFKVGAAEVSDEQQKDPMFQSMFERGAIFAIAEKKEEQSQDQSIGVDLAELSVADAKTLIDTFNLGEDKLLDLVEKEKAGKNRKALIEYLEDKASA